MSQSDSAEFRFGAFRLRGRNGPLLHDDTPVRIRPKALALLWMLVRQPGEVIPKSTLLDAVWPGGRVSDESLTFQIQELRRLLGDDPKSPRYIATAHRIGFRFAMPVTKAGIALEAPTRDLFVGREAELGVLGAHLLKAVRGQRQLVFVSGEAGIGKSALLDAFSLSAASDPLLRVIRGQCLDQKGTGEPYLPVLDALSQLLLKDADGSTIDLLRRAAPSWLAQLPAVLEPSEQALLQRQTAGMKRSRMVRELAEALDLLTAHRDLLLLIEDLHWSDHATVELLAMLAQRREKARLMLVVTVRPADAMAADHPIRTLQLSLSARGLASSLSLGPLDVAAVDEYMKKRFGPVSATPALTTRIHAHSGGHPMFLVLSAEYLMRGGNERDADLAGLNEDLPQALRDLIEVQFSHLPSEALLALESAAVAGFVFSAGAVAAATGGNVEVLEAQLERLAQRGQFIEAQGLSVWPDGTTSGRYRFRHALYEQVLRRRLSAARLARMHRLVAERIESAFGVRSDEVAGELATHFEIGGVLDKALHYRIGTAKLAFQRCAPDTVRQEVAGGLALLEAFPAGEGRNHAELALRVIAVRALQVEHGYVSEFSHEHLSRIPPLLQGVSDAVLLEQGLSAMWMARHFGGRLEEALVYAERIMRMGRELGKPLLQSCGHAWSSLTQHVMGRRCSQSDQETVRALRLASGVISETPGLRAVEPGCAALLSRAVVRWYMGYPDHALKLAHDASDCANNLENPYAQCIAQVGALGCVLMLRRDWDALLDTTEKAIPLCQKYAHQDGLLWARRQRGVALFMLGHAEEGLEMLFDALAEHSKTGVQIGLPLDYVHAAECLLQANRLDEARNTLDQGWAIIRERGMRAWEPDAMRVEAEWQLRCDPNASIAAESLFRRAIELAGLRQVLSLQLRAATSLARLLAGQGRRAEATGILTPLYAQFSEGWNTVDLRAAKILIEALRGV